MFQLSVAGRGWEFPALDALENRVLWKCFGHKGNSEIPFSVANREGCVFLVSWRNNGSPFSKPPHQLSCLLSLLLLWDFSPWPCPPAVGIPKHAYLPKRDLPFLAPYSSACAITSSRAVGIATSPALSGTGSTCTSTTNSQCAGGSKALTNVTNNL